MFGESRRPPIGRPPATSRARCALSSHGPQLRLHRDVGRRRRGARQPTVATSDRFTVSRTGRPFVVGLRSRESLPAGDGGLFPSHRKRSFVRGPIVTTRSTRDTAVGSLLSNGRETQKQLLLVDTKYPKYGGIGSFGIQGIAIAHDLPMQSVQHAYAFKPGDIYNLEASHVVKNGSGASGAHSDIAHPEVAHAFWAAALALLPRM